MTSHLTIDQNENSVCYTLLFGKNDTENVHILNAARGYILSTERFNIPLSEYV